MGYSRFNLVRGFSRLKKYVTLPSESKKIVFFYLDVGSSLNALISLRTMLNSRLLILTGKKWDVGVNILTLKIAKLLLQETE